jgi:hypothetical protein
MNKSPHQFAIGHYRPIYLWGGPGTIRMNKLKFMDVEVDEFVHHEVHTPVGADRVLNRMYCNWVHLMYDWGFPPEVEEEDWDAFEQAAVVYHDGGTKVLAYIQSSNCVYDGSFREKDWYAADPKGHKVTYFTYSGRYMACLAHPDWRQHLKDLIRGAIERGADGIFFDNIFQGDQPISLLSTWLGTTGCHCPLCQQAYLEQTGASIPNVISQDPAFARYLRWRANQVTQLISDMAAYANQCQPGTPISANDFDPVMRDSYLLYGIDLAALAQVQDVTMIENFGLPRWSDGPRTHLVNNALNVRTARSLVGSAAHLSMLSYDVGIGFDPVYPPHRYRQGIAEATACGASMTTKGTEYHDGEKMTLLTASEYGPIHAALGQYHAWLEANAHLFTAGRQNVAPVGLLFPGDALWLDWHRLAPVYFGAGQALTVAGIPWKVIQPGDPLENLETVLVFDQASLQAILPSSPVQAHVLFVPELASWRPAPPSIVDRSPWLRNITASAVKAALKAYADYKFFRWAMDSAGLPKLITQTPLYAIPAESARQALLDALPDDLYPRLESRKPALIEVWKDQDTLQVHLVNYAAHPQDVQIRFRSSVTGRVLSPDGEDDKTYEGAQLDIALDVYKILLISPGSHHDLGSL